MTTTFIVNYFDYFYEKAGEKIVNYHKVYEAAILFFQMTI